jgi:amidase
LKVAILWDDGIIKPHPPITMALHKVAERLHANEIFEVVDWKPYKHDLAWEIIVSAIPSISQIRSVQ